MLLDKFNFVCSKAYTLSVCGGSKVSQRRNSSHGRGPVPGWRHPTCCQFEVVTTRFVRSLRRDFE